MRKNTQCEALMVTGSVPFGEAGHSREGDRCASDGDLLALDGAVRCLCWTHRQVAEAETRELAMVPPLMSYAHASEVAAAE